MEISTIGVVGCGIMGSGIAQISAQAGYEVFLSEINEDTLEKGISSIENSLAKLVEKGRIKPDEKLGAMSRIKGVIDINEFAVCNLIIEAATEKIDLKRSIFNDLDKICPQQTILATNTSSVSVIDVASATNRSERVLGMHFFNPVPVMKLLEVVKTVATSDDTIKTAVAFGKSVGKTVIIAKNTPAFIVNRLAVPFILSAIRMLESGVATKEDIDTGINLGLNHPMGPLTLADFIGLDTLYYLARGAYEDTGDHIWIPPILLKDMVSAGWFGCKTGRGFYIYK